VCLCYLDVNKLEDVFLQVSGALFGDIRFFVKSSMICSRDVK
jgi:hypothetical protein